MEFGQTDNRYKRESDKQARFWCFDSLPNTEIYADQIEHPGNNVLLQIYVESINEWHTKVHSG